MITRRYANCIRLLGKVPKNYEYIIWVFQQWREFQKETNSPKDCSSLTEYQDLFDVWLDRK